MKNNSKFHILGSILFFVLSLISGEMSIFLPFLITIYIYLFESKQIRKLKLHVRKLAPFYILLAAYLIFYFMNVSLPTADYGRSFNLVSMSRLLVKYLLYPFFAGFDRSTVFTSLNSLMIFRALIIIGAATFVLVRSTKYLIRWPIIAFSSLWFLITVSIFLTLPGHTFSYLANIPSIGLALLIGYIFTLILSSIRVGSIKLLVMFGFILLNFTIIFLAREVDPDLRWHKRLSNLSRSSHSSLVELYPTISKDQKIKVFYDDPDVLDAIYYGNLVKAIYPQSGPSVELIKGTDRIIRGGEDIILIWKGGGFEKP